MKLYITGSPHALGFSVNDWPIILKHDHLDVNGYRVSFKPRWWLRWC